MADNNEATSPELAVLYERISRVLDDYQELRGMVISQNTAIQQFAVIHKDISILDAKTDRMFKALSAQSDLATQHGAKLQTHSAIWKIVGAVLLACSGLVGWSYTTIEGLRQADTAIDRRVLQLEMKFDAAEQLRKGWTNGKTN